MSRRFKFHLGISVIRRSTRIVLVLACLATLVFAEFSFAQTLTILHQFEDSPDGSSPWGGLVRDDQGNFYGTTFQGGKLGFGTVFQMKKSGAETILHSFAGGVDGANPWTGLTRDSAGNLYGTTYSGGGPHCFDKQGCGTVFQVASDGKGGWKEKIIYSFAGGKKDGEHPGYGDLVIDQAGNLYGVTIYGGARACGDGCGAVFELSLNPQGKWQRKLLHRFTWLDGAYPYAGLLRIAGTLYGTTFTGGSGSCGCGTVFSLDQSGKLTILHNFGGAPDGAAPFGGLTADNAGNLYGTTWSGGNSSLGTVYKVEIASGIETVLHGFAGYPSDGSTPYVRLARDAAGNLYGTTYYGGSGGGFCQDNGQDIGCGTVFRVSADGTETILHNFVYEIDGAEITGGVILDKKGNLYGTTSVGGPGESRAGIAYKLSPQ